MTFTNDIALVKLNRKVRFSDKVQPIKLPKGGLSYQGYQAYVSGWGIQGPYEGPSSRLKGAELVVSIIQCNLDLVTLNIVTTCDLVTNFQSPFFNLLHKIIQFSDIMRFSHSQNCH